MRKKYLCLLLTFCVCFTACNPAVGATPEKTVNINSDSAQKLAKCLKGVGPAKALNIIVFRLENGPFKSADELVLVNGISQRLLELNRKRIRLK